MIVKQNRSEIHRRKSESRNTNFPDESAVRSGRENSRGDLELVLVGGARKGLEPRVLLRHRGHLLVVELMLYKEVDSSTGLFHPSSELVLEGDNVYSRRHPDVESDGEHVGDNVQQDSSFHHCQIDCGDVT